MASSARRGAIAAIGFASLLLAGPAAATITYDFNSGIGPDFNVSTNGGLFSVGEVADRLRISKPAEPGLVTTTPAFGGVSSNFQLGGDFRVTVDFALHSFDAPAGDAMLNESVLNVASGPTDFVLALRFRLGSQDLAEIFDQPPGAPSGPIVNTSAATGRYRLTRTGNMVSGDIDLGAGLQHFTDVVFNTNDVTVSLAAAQLANSGNRSTTALDISFDNLEIIADRIIRPAAVPEPASLGLLGLGLAALGLGRRRRA